MQPLGCITLACLLLQCASGSELSSYLDSNAKRIPGMIRRLAYPSREDKKLLRKDKSLPEVQPPLLKVVGVSLDSWGSLHVEEKVSLHERSGHAAVPQHTSTATPSQSLLTLVGARLGDWGWQAEKPRTNQSIASSHTKLALPEAHPSERPSEPTLSKLKTRPQLRSKQLDLGSKQLDLGPERLSWIQKLALANFVVFMCVVTFTYFHGLPNLATKHLRWSAARGQDEVQAKKAITATVQAKKAIPATVALRPLPVVQTEWGWCLRECCEEQALTMGLLHLSTRIQFFEDEGDSAGNHFLRGQLMANLCDGSTHLSQVHPSDLAAAQGDVAKLAISQLLCLSIKYGRAGERSPQSDFLKIVENILYERLGCRALKMLTLTKPAQKEEIRQLGREAVLLVAVGAAIPTTRFWNWWVGEHRTFFNTTKFSCCSIFPQTGVLEFADSSKTGSISGSVMGWQIHLVTDERDLMPLDGHH